MIFLFKGAFCSLMENGGNQEHRPWKFDSTNQTVDIYRFFVNAHLSLSTYLLSGIYSFLFKNLPFLNFEK